MAIVYEAIDVRFPKLLRRNTSDWIKKVIDSYQKRVGEIVFIFCSDVEILRMNSLYLHHKYYTDIITFDYSENNVLSGDLYISLDTVQSNAKKYRTEFLGELRRVMIHGILHLCGFDDKTSADKQTMRKEENEALQRYGI